MRRMQAKGQRRATPKVQVSPGIFRVGVAAARR
jgi:hypothetical protein